MSTDPHYIDVHVGQKIRQRRNQLGVSQAALGEALGLTFQQIQKYERGANRVSASKLLMVAHELEVPISFFFDGLNYGSESFELSAEERAEILKVFGELPGRSKREALLQLAREMSKPLS